MTEMTEKKGKLKVTVEFEVNEELMDLAKDAMSKMSMKIPEMWKRHGGERKNKQKSRQSVLFPKFFHLT